MLFGVVSDSKKDALGRAGNSLECAPVLGAVNPVTAALQALRADTDLDDLLLMADVCLCEYTSHGHCGVPRCFAAGNSIDGGGCN